MGLVVGAISLIISCSTPVESQVTTGRSTAGTGRFLLQKLEMELHNQTRLMTTYLLYGKFIISNYNSQEAIDNSDGSNYYSTHDNFFADSSNGMKNDFDGDLHDNHHYNNIYAYVGNGFRIVNRLPGHEDMFYNNMVIMTKDGDYGHGSCSGPGMTIVHDNKVYTPTGKATECRMCLSDWQAKGNDPGTTAAVWPSDNVLVSATKKLFNL